jgi:hypothetical protein
MTLIALACNRDRLSLHRALQVCVVLMLQNRRTVLFERYSRLRMTLCGVLSMERSLVRLSSMVVYVGLLFATVVRSALATSAANQDDAMEPESLVAAYHAAVSKTFSFDLVVRAKSHAIIVVDRGAKSKLNSANEVENNKTSYRVLEQPVVRSFVSKQLYRRGKFRTDLLEVGNAIKDAQDDVRGLGRESAWPQGTFGTLARRGRRCQVLAIMSN